MRYFELDALRAIAIIMMVVFHLLWDLNYFGFTNAEMYFGFWGIWQKITAGLFLLLVGIVLNISWNRRKNALHFLKRGIVIFCGGLLITAFTLIAFPEQFIYFGVLHLIGVSIILAMPECRHQRHYK